VQGGCCWQHDERRHGFADTGHRHKAQSCSTTIKNYPAAGPPAKGSVSTGRLKEMAEKAASALAENVAEREKMLVAQSSPPQVQATPRAKRTSRPGSGSKSVRSRGCSGCDKEKKKWFAA